MYKLRCYIQDFLLWRHFLFSHILYFFNTIIFFYFVLSIRRFMVYFLSREYGISVWCTYAIKLVFITWFVSLILYWYIKDKKNIIIWWNIILCTGFCIVLTVNPGVYTDDMSFWLTQEGMISFSKPLICNLYWSFLYLIKHELCAFASYVEFVTISIIVIKLFKKKKIVTKMEKMLTLLILLIVIVNFSYMFFIKGFTGVGLDLSTQNLFYLYMAWFTVVVLYMFI